MSGKENACVVQMSDNNVTKLLEAMYSDLIGLKIEGSNLKKNKNSNKRRNQVK